MTASVKNDRTLGGLPFAVMAARRHQVDSHRRAMVGFFTGGLLLAGALTFLPGALDAEGFLWAVRRRYTIHSEMEP